MRNRHFVVLAGLSLFSWAAITSYLFLQRPQGKVTPSLHSDLDQLNSELQNQYQLNDQLLKRLLTLHNALGSQSGIVEVVSPEVDDNKAPAPTGPVIAVLLFACNRVTVTRSLDLLIKYRPTKENFPIIVSQDCDHPQTAKAIKGYGEQIRHIQQPDQSDVSVLPKEKKFKGYYKIARHYGWALNQTFYHFNYDTVIIVEDDLDIAPDFFDYFLATYSLLRSDPTLWCVSAWNDNGKDGMIQEDPELLHRTDFFPGLGWMLTKELWGELQWHWPKSYWDDWMRQPEQRKERACIRPEISRTRTFGKIGVSNGLFYEKHLKYIKLNEKPVPFTTMDLSYLKKDNYDQRFVKAVYDCPVVSWEQLKANKITQPGEVRVTYTSKETYKKITKAFGLMEDLKSGVPRTGYRGVVSFVFKGRKVYLAPPADWKGYDTTWS